MSATSTYLDDLREQDPALYEIEMRGATRVDAPASHQRKFLDAFDDSRMRVLGVTANCSTAYTAVHSSGRRSASDIRWVVLHDEEGMTAVGAAAWFQDRRSEGSAQLCADAGSCYRTLSDLVIPWAAPGANTNGWHLELAGYAAWTRAEWLAHHGTLYRGAFKAYFHARKYGIPYRYLTDRQLAGRTQKGFITHRQITRVFGGGTHTDPGSNFPEDVFMKQVKQFANV